MKVLYALFIVLVILSCESEKNPIAVDSTPPTVEIISPANGASVYENALIECRVTDQSGVKKVQIYVDGLETQMILTKEPFRFTFNTLIYPDSSYHILKAVAEDSKGNIGESTPITVLIDNSSASPGESRIVSVAIVDTNLEARWSKSRDSDFSSYTLEHSLDSAFGQPGVAYISNDVNDTTTIITDLTPLKPHFFRMVVTDSFGLKSTGNIVGSEVAMQPDPVNILEVFYDYQSMTVRWEASTLGTFKAYKLLHSFSENGLRDTIAVINAISQNTFILDNFDPTYENWFWIMVYDAWGRNATGQGLSNQIDPPPASVDLYPVFYNDSRFVLKWQESGDADFHEYQLFESSNEHTEDSVLVFSSEDRSITTFTISSITYGEERFYQMRVIDYWGQTADGEIEEAKALYKLAYISNLDGRDRVFWMNEDGSGQERIVPNNPIFQSDPVWAPDFSRIYFQMGNNDIDLYSVGTDLTPVTRLTNMQGWDRDLVAARSGAFVVFRSDGGVYRMEPDGSNLLLLANYPELPLWPDISPDEQKIVWAARSGGADWHIYIVDSDGSNQSQLTNNAGWDARMAKFSRDGQLVYYWARNKNMGVLSDIFSVDFAGVETNLTNHSNLFGDTYSFDISADGEYIVYDLVRSATESQIIKINLLSGVKTILSNSPLDNELYPVFSNDGSSIFFTSQRMGDLQVYRMNSDGSNVQQLTDGPGICFRPKVQPIWPE